MTPEKQDKTLELSKHWSADSTPDKNIIRIKKDSKPIVPLHETSQGMNQLPYLSPTSDTSQ